MAGFLQQTATHILEQNPRLEGINIILPSRRAAVFLKKELSRQITAPVWSPPINTIEEFLLENLGLDQADQPTLLFQLYEAYDQVSDKAESFADFSQWANLLLADFNEIDRYLVDAGQLFTYLADVERIKKWDLKGGEPSEMLKKYLALWERLPEVYTRFYQNILAEGRVYQGVAYREMANRLDELIPALKEGGNKYIFIGFNALNTAEEKILRKLYHEGLAEFYWDVDEYYFKDPDHEAGNFLRQSKLVQELLAKDDFRWLHNSLTELPKNIKVVNVSGNQQQAVAANVAVLDFKAAELEEVAVVMADENLLSLFLANLADEVDGLNITMGIALSGSLAAGFFNLLLGMFQEQESAKRKDKAGMPAYHFQRWDDLLGHALFRRWLGLEKDYEKLRQEIRVRNRIYLSINELAEWRPGLFSSEVQEFFNQNYNGQPARLWRQLAQLCQQLHYRQPEKSSLLQSLYGFFKLFNRLSDLMESYPYVEDLKTAVRFFRDLIRSETLDIEGDPLSGLQLMGMLETRTLDFKNLVITSLNEDVLPKGRSENSLVPFDIKREFGLPTYLEKDAVYAYHFYRLLQRAENVTLIYNGHSDGLGTGEASRFIKQLQFELQRKNRQARIKTTSPYFEVKAQPPEEIVKTPALMKRLEEMAEKGISPTALIDYVNDPLKFYRRRVLGLREPEEVEEVAGYDTQGTIVHELLEEYYRDQDGNPKAVLDPEDEVFSQSEDEIRRQVVARLTKAGLSQLEFGKNLLIREILTGMIFRFLREEKKQLQEGAEEGLNVSLLGLEQELKVPLQLADGRVVHVRGIIDRIDRLGSTVRVIDYKTGAVSKSDLGFQNMEQLGQPNKKNKSLQLMIYAWLYQRQYQEHIGLQTGIISLRNAGDWLMEGKYKSKSQIGAELVNEFEEFLKSLLEEIFDPNLTFSEKLLTLQSDE